MKSLLIIGSGIAGMALASEIYNKRKYNITILESGGVSSKKNQDLNQEEKINNNKLINDLNLSDVEYEYSSRLGWLNNLDRLRFRGLGGSAKYWGSESQLFLNADLERDYDNNGKWPLKFQELNYYYNKAIKLFGFKRKYLSTSKKYKLFNEIYWSRNQDTQKVSKKLYNFLKNKIKIITEATCLEIIFSQNKAVSAMVNIKGKLEIINFDTVVLSCGAIESTRLLMNSLSLKKNMKIKNYNNLGKFFLDHPHGYIGSINNTSKSFQKEFVKQNIYKNKNIYYKGIRLNQLSNNNKDLLGISFQFREENKYNNFKKNLRNIYICYKNRNYLNIIFELINILRNTLLLRYLFNSKVVRIWAVAEQDPLYKSQIKKFRSKDILGSKKININWKMSNRLLNTVKYTLPKLESLLIDLGCKNIKFNEIGKDKLAGLHGGAHHFGTTRMSTNNKKSFVDKNQKIIGINNCFINSTSVFPTNGTANSGLTLIALAMRLANHLNKIKY